MHCGPAVYTNCNNYKKDNLFFFDFPEIRLGLYHVCCIVVFIDVIGILISVTYLRCTGGLSRSPSIHIC